MSTHVPVLLGEVMQYLAPSPGNKLLDATLGHGGHAKAYLDAADNTLVVGIDADTQALEAAKQNLAPYGDRVTYVHGTFARISDLAGDMQYDHVLFDLGIGSHQIADESRGFSFNSDAPLIMRYGSDEGLPPSDFQYVAWLEKRLGRVPDALDLIERLSEEELADMIWRYGEERMSRRIARGIKKNASSIHTAKELAQVITDVTPASYEKGRIHPATRTFQALRLTVNRELESIRVALPQAQDLLVPGGVLAVISFHSLEDRIVKQFVRASNTLEVVTKKPITATQEEIGKNPRSRSAKLRIANKT